MISTFSVLCIQKYIHCSNRRLNHVGTTFIGFIAEWYIYGKYNENLLGLFVATLLLLLKAGRVDADSKPGNNFIRSYKHLPAAHWKKGSSSKQQTNVSEMYSILIQSYETNQQGTVNTPCFLSFHFICLFLKLQFWIQKLHVCL
jgi:hypothetical protein